MQIIRRQRSKQTQTLQEQLLNSAKLARDKAKRIGPGRKREVLLRKARQAEITAGTGRAISNLLARKQKLTEQLARAEDADERENIAHQLHQINTALDLLEK